MADAHDTPTDPERLDPTAEPIDTAASTEAEIDAVVESDASVTDAQSEAQEGEHSDGEISVDDADDAEPEPDPEAINRVVERLEIRVGDGDIRTASRGEEGDVELLPIDPVVAPCNLLDDGAAEAAIAADTADEASEADDNDDAAQKSLKAVSEATERGERAMRGVTKSKLPAKPQVMIVNDTPDECRIGVLEENVLQAYFTERSLTATHVGNIYKGRVLNIEPAIQAAFVDFGEGASGFLHISDLHPKYFPGKERTERVGKKIPRRDRPLIQDALKKGQEITVQVIKEGLGSKGPTLTSYISLPGRLLVMMPDMGRVGVSRKVEDEDERRSMRRMLDSLELPDGFGFIMRTAGYERSLSELKRDAAYLMRLWEAMQARQSKTSGPCALYTEGDLLIRTIRDSGDPCMKGVVVDSISAFDRATQYLDVVAPAHAPAVYYYDRPIPIFSAFGIEDQVELLHQREVPLPSGGALVIDQTEAMVAIDVNSGRSRSARDSETNAYQTNIEAVREICRQLRLRDLGGLIVNDLIDMRMSKHRKDIEARIEEELKRDRAKATHLPISEFGMVEMTRQRMRPSMRKTHYSDCPHCAGSGEIRMADVVAADALRRVALLFAYLAVKRVQVTLTSRVAGELLSARRRALQELEEKFGKPIEVTIDDDLRGDQFKVVAYDDRNHAIEQDRLPRPPRPLLADLYTDVPEYVDDEETDERVKRRRRRRRKPMPADANAILLAGGFDDLPEVIEDERPLMSVIREEADTVRTTRKATKAVAEPREGDDEPSGNRDRPAREGREEREGRSRRGGRNRRRRRAAPSLPVAASLVETAALCGVEPAALLDMIRAAHPEIAPLVTDGLETLSPTLVAVARDLFNNPMLGAADDESDGADQATSNAVLDGEAADDGAGKSEPGAPERAARGDDGEGDGKRKRRRRGGRNRRGRDRDRVHGDRAPDSSDAPRAEGEGQSPSEPSDEVSDDGAAPAQGEAPGAAGDADSGSGEGSPHGDGEGSGRRRSRRGGRNRRGRDSDERREPRGERRPARSEGSAPNADAVSDSPSASVAPPAPRSETPPTAAQGGASAADASTEPKPVKRRGLYGGSTRRLKPSESPKGRSE